MNLQILQYEVAEWGKRNFPNALPHQPLLGVAEETGELSHAHLKMEQGIRGTLEEHKAAKIDAVGDIMVFLSHYCSLNDINLDYAVTKTWNEVKQRDWMKNKMNGALYEKPML